MKYRKAILKANRTYHSPDGALDVESSRLTHWAEQFNAMKAAGLAVPVSWDHSDDPDKDVPIKFDSSSKRRPSQGTVGYLHSVTVAPSGEHAEIELDIRGRENNRQVKDNLAFVSPVVRSKWADGDGKVWEDIWGHMDLVQHPVDHRQTPFEPVPEDQAVACALRLGLDEGHPQTYRLQEDGAMPDEDKKADENPGGDAVSDDSGRLKKVIEALSKNSIVLADDTTAENLLERLESALLTRNAMDGDTDEELEVVQPSTASFNLDKHPELAKQRQYLDGQHQVGVRSRLSAVLKSGRCTPAEFKREEAKLSTVRLNLDTNGTPQRGELENWVESREAIPIGSCWEPEVRTRMAAVDVIEPSSEFMEGRELTDEQSEAEADKILSR